MKFKRIYLHKEEVLPYRFRLQDDDLTDDDADDLLDEEDEEDDDEEPQKKAPEQGFESDQSGYEESSEESE